MLDFGFFFIMLIDHMTSFKVYSAFFFANWTLEFTQYS